MDIAVVVDYIGQKVFVGAKKTPMRKVKVTQLDTKENLEVSVFSGKEEDDDFNFIVGQEALMDIEAKEYKGNMQYSAGAWKCRPLTEPSEKAEIFQGTREKETPMTNAPGVKKAPAPPADTGYQAWYDGKFKRFCDICSVIKDLSPEYQQAIAKDVKELIL